jgi:redox-sensitive bicupin YhaK (pirin superfamily)
VWPHAEALRRLTLRSSPLDLEDISGRILFPTIERGPWPPFERFVEVSMRSLGSSDPHAHAGEEALVYVLEGPLRHDDGNGRSTTLGPGSVLLVTAPREVRHDLSMREGSHTRWLAVVLRLPERAPLSEPSVQTATARRTEAETDDVRRTPVAGRAGPVRPVTGLECLDLSFEKDADASLAPGPDRRTVVYTLDGSALVDGKTVPASSAVALDGVPEIRVRGEAGSRLIAASAPRSS